MTANGLDLRLFHFLVEIKLGFPLNPQTVFFSIKTKTLFAEGSLQHREPSHAPGPPPPPPGFASASFPGASFQITARGEEGLRGYLGNLGTGVVTSMLAPGPRRGDGVGGGLGMVDVGWVGGSGGWVA